MKKTEPLYVSQYEADEFTRFCNEPPDNCGRDETVFDEEVVFDDGKRMVIQVIASGEPDKEPCWTQGVLLTPEGEEIGSTDVGESFLGEYSVWDGKVEYETTVTVRDEYLEGIMRHGED